MGIQDEPRDGSSATLEEQESMLYKHDDARTPSPSATRSERVDSNESVTTTPSGMLKGTSLPPWMIILLWISLSTTVIFYNREIMVGKAQFRYPITLTTLHLLYQTIVSFRQTDIKGGASKPATRILHRYTDLVSGSNSNSKTSSGANGVKYTALPMTNVDSSATGNGVPVGVAGASTAVDQDDELRRNKDASVAMSWHDWKIQILPPALMFSASLVLSNWAYLYLTTAYIQMLKAFGPVAYLLAAFALGTKAFSAKSLAIVCVISTCVGVASYGEANFNLIGFSIQATAIAIEATRVTLIQILLQGGDMSPLKSLYWLEAFRAIPRLGLFTIATNCTLTFLLNLSGVYLISLSSMVLSLTKVVKDILLVAGSALVLGDQLTMVQGIAYAIATVGLLFYKASG
ncbi:hypothetical protein OIO90_003794 [Microbotryomycetes sp. JL221]|nr:hypothetical protein OIO90_003794 [Microbotryomycetes sp. JL221]